MTADAPETFTDCVERIEKAYEFMLAYAAQGRAVESTGSDGPAIRQYVTDLAAGLAKVGMAAENRLAELGQSGGAFSDFAGVLSDDAEKAGRAVALVLASPNISSQLIDNLNASQHLRALLTDIFLFDETVKTVAR